VQILAVAQLAELTGPNQPTVAEVLKILMAADLLETQRDTNGGYCLACPAIAISLVQIVEAMEEPIVVNNYVDGTVGPCMASNCCCRSGNWNRVERALAMHLRT
jgi:DNA-binding IscR family transcriptional regulator